MDETLAKKISKTLTGLCPAFSDSKASTAVWHGCNCAVTGSACECVWHLTSECNGGKWKQLAFIDKHDAEEQKKRNIMLDAVIATRNA